MKLFNKLKQPKWNKMKKLFAPPLGTQERDGWDKCVDTPKHLRENLLSEIVNILNGKGFSGLHHFAKGWLDAYDTERQNTD